jgi:ATP-dependent DNA helicase RecQ
VNYTAENIADEFYELQSRLRDWNLGGWPGGYTWKVERINTVFRNWRSDPDAQSTVGPLDVVAIVAHAMRMASANGVDPVELRVPSNGWPTVEDWSKAGVRANPEGDNFRLKLEPIHFDWMTEDDVTRVFDPAFMAEQRRKVDPSLLPIDPYIPLVTPLKFDGYTSYGQREAVRAAFQCKPGRTMVVNLPTGLGKSMVGYAPALDLKKKKLTVVVVPTVALALDQEKSLQELCPEEFLSTAYYGDLPEQIRTSIKSRIRQGKQGVVFASPESIVGSLSLALKKAASAGRLGYFVVDEAHIVAQWGEEFRPEFQSMAGFRSELLRACETGGKEQFRTLLLSATLTAESYDVLRYLFGSDGEVDHVSAPAIRPEPEAWLGRARSKSERERCLMQAIRCAPRPALVYVTKVVEARSWLTRVQKAGFRRSATVHGKVTAADREKILTQWKNRELDLIVATSAFGLGIDQSDVRSVIHACIPETLDRYYQEIGRGGRDGRASLALLMATADDENTARSVSENRRIGAEKGHARWSTMWLDREELGDMRYSLQLRQVPSHVDGDSKANRGWNLRTISLLAKAGVLLFDGRPPPDFGDEPEADDEEARRRHLEQVDDYFQQCIVKIVNQDAEHDRRSFWDGHMEAVRQKASEADAKGLKNMLSLIDDAATNPHALYHRVRDSYRIPGVVDVAPSAEPMAEVYPKMSVVYPEVRAGRDFHYFADAEDWERPFTKLVTNLPQVDEILCTPRVRIALLRPSWRRFFRRRYRQVNDLLRLRRRKGGVVVICIHPDDDLRLAVASLHQALFQRQGSQLVCFLPKRAPHPTIPGRLAKDSGAFFGNLAD